MIALSLEGSKILILSRSLTVRFQINWHFCIGNIHMALLKVRLELRLNLLFFVRHPWLIRSMRLIRFPWALPQLIFVNSFQMVDLHLFQIIRTGFLLELILTLINKLRMLIRWCLSVVTCHILLTVYLKVLLLLYCHLLLLNTIDNCLLLLWWDLIRALVLLTVWAGCCTLEIFWVNFLCVV